MVNRFISDLHFNHPSIIEYTNRPFKNVSEMNTALIRKWNGVVSNEDITYIIGDIGLGNKRYLKSLINKLHGKKRLIIGNHDARNNIKHENFSKYLQLFTKYQVIYENQYNVLLIHDISQIFGERSLGIFNLKLLNGIDIILCGHVLNNWFFKERPAPDGHIIPCLNVSVEQVGYRPLTLKELMVKYNKDKTNGVLTVGTVNYLEAKDFGGLQGDLQRKS